ncbi:MAG TPA: DNA translocase FtsK 4TM domain-containing protein, partial [Saprospiraceae bacterium]|nr:DNA translocase FtsK 4TM domain-containing protein [Saprospiraceae bacterium]
MSAKKEKTKSSQQSSTWSDERWRKVFGIVSLLAAIYLAIAFVSYLYTWKFDQDKVLHFTWSSFFQKDLAVENWLGRLGAYISNAFFYYGFGLPSMVVVILLLRLGVDLIKRNPIKPLLILSRNLIAAMAFFSLVLEFTFRSSAFTWGGAFGESLCLWLTNFVGSVGLFLLLFASAFTFVVWRFNINLDQYSFAFSGLPMPARFNGLAEKFDTWIQAYRTEYPDPEVIVKEKTKKKTKSDSMEDAMPKTDEVSTQEAPGSQLDFELPVAAPKAKAAYVPPVLEMDLPAVNEVPLDDEGEEPTGFLGEEVADDMDDDFIIENLSD